MKSPNTLVVMFMILFMTVFFMECTVAQDSSPYSGTIVVDGDSIVVDGALVEGQTEIINGQLLITKTSIEDRDSTVTVQVVSYKDSTYQFQVEKIDSFSINLNGTMEKIKIGSSERVLSQTNVTVLTPTQSVSLRTGAYQSGTDYILPDARSTINTKYYEVTAGDIITIEAVVTHPDAKQFTQISVYSYDASGVTVGKTQGSLWAVNGPSSKCYYSLVVAEGVSKLTVEITKSSLSTAPSIFGEQIVHSFKVYEGLDIPAVANRASFDGTFDISENGVISKDGTPIFIWGIYPDGSRDYSVYKAQGFNAVIGNYPGSNDLAACKAAGMYSMPNIAPFIIPTNYLYADYANFRSRLTSMVPNKDHLILYWDHEQYNQYDVPKEILSIAREVLPLTPVIVNLGNIGMARLWRSDVDGIMTYANAPNITQTFKIINNMDDDGLTVPGSMVVISIFDDQLSAAELRTKVLRAVNAGAMGIGLFKDGIPADLPNVKGDITTFRIWDSLPALMAEVEELLSAQ